MYLPNLKSVALHVPDIIAIAVLDLLRRHRHIETETYTHIDRQTE